jgi:hypothetical protein
MLYASLTILIVGALVNAGGVLWAHRLGRWTSRREVLLAVAVDLALVALGIAMWVTHRIGQILPVIVLLDIVMWRLLSRHLGRRIASELQRRDRIQDRQLL